MPDWNTLFNNPENRWLEPHEKVIAFTGYFSGMKSPRFLDLGCGAGRHVVYLASNGFDTYGCDVSENGLQYTRDWLEREGLKATLAKMDMTCLLYPDAFFDGLISLFVIYHNPMAKIQKSLSEISRVLRPGGWALLTFLSKRGYRYGHGKQIEPDTFISIEGDDAGQPHHFSDLAEFDREFKELTIRQVELFEEPVEHGQRHSHWAVLAQKPGFPGD